MDILMLCLNIAQAIALFIVALFAKRYLPSYMDEKGKNLATKEDIQEITHKTEAVQNEFREKFEKYSVNLRFMNDFFYKQYSKLYCELYIAIIQSESTRKQIKLYDHRNIAFEEVPFIENSSTDMQSAEQENQKRTDSVNCTSKTLRESIDRLNRQYLINCILSNSDLASQHLLKLAISYRSAYVCATDDPTVRDIKDEKIASEQEIKLLREIVCCIVKEYNQYRKSLNMDYSTEEIENGIPSLD